MRLTFELVDYIKKNTSLIWGGLKQSAEDLSRAK